MKTRKHRKPHKKHKRKGKNFEHLLYTPKQASFIVHNLGAPRHFPHVYQFQGGSIIGKRIRGGNAWDSIASFFS